MLNVRRLSLVFSVLTLVAWVAILTPPAPAFMDAVPVQGMRN